MFAHEINRPGVNGRLEDLLLSVDPETGFLGCGDLADFVHGIGNGFWHGVTVREGVESEWTSAGESIALAFPRNRGKPFRTHLIAR